MSLGVLIGLALMVPSFFLLLKAVKEFAFGEAIMFAAIVLIAFLMLAANWPSL